LNDCINPIAALTINPQNDVTSLNTSNGKSVDPTCSIAPLVMIVIQMRLSNKQWCNDIDREYSGSAAKGVGLRPVDRWHSWFESC
jgi:hypothetical protein